MNIDYEELLPDWWYADKDKKDLVLSNDIDSLASCALLKQKKGWEVRYFYDFEKSYASEKLKNNIGDRVWVDVAVLNGEKAFDNHVSMVSFWDDPNEQMINPNLLADVTNARYTNKYAGSTLLMLWSLYNMPLPSTEEGKMLLLCIDCAFKGHYNDKFAEQNQFYLCDMFGFGELYEVMERHKIGEFYDLIDKYHLNEELYWDGKEIKTELDLEKISELLELPLELPTGRFIVWKEYEIKTEKIEDYINQVQDIARNIFTLAFTYKDNARYSRVI